MGPGFVGGKLQQGGHAVSFLLGAALPTALLFFLASDRLGEGLSTISASWRGNGTTTASLRADAPPADIPTAADGRAAPAQDHEVRTRRLSTTAPERAFLGLLMLCI